jgi:hypothetical protein
MSRYAPDPDAGGIQSRFQDPMPQPNRPHNTVDLHTHTDCCAMPLLPARSPPVG